MKYFITAIGTDSGKTLISAIFTEALKADYWKPIQAGFPKDSEAVSGLISNNESKILEEAFVLNTPASPHYAAEVDGIDLKIQDVKLPISNNKNIIIEGAGGMLVPINEKEYVVDIAAAIDCEIILVCNLYLGSINHSLLSINELKRRGLKVKGIIFNGPSNPSSEDIIEKHAQWPVLLRVNQEKVVDQEVVRQYAEELKANL